MEHVDENWIYPGVFTTFALCGNEGHRIAKKKVEVGQ